MNLLHYFLSLAWITFSQSKHHETDEDLPRRYYQNIQARQNTNSKIILPIQKNLENLIVMIIKNYWEILVNKKAV